VGKVKKSNRKVRDLKIINGVQKYHDFNVKKEKGW